MADLMSKDIEEEYAKHHSIFKTAKSLGVQVGYVKAVVDALPSTPKVASKDYLWDGFGDPKKREWLVARMLASETWDNTIPEVAEARERFEAGTHLLCTGRDGPFILLYSIPRIVKEPNKGYFELKTEM